MAAPAFADDRGWQDDRRPVADRLSPGWLGPGPSPVELVRSQQKNFPADNEAASYANAIDLCVESNMYEVDAPGAAVAVVLDGDTIYKRGYGVKFRGGSDAVDADTIFRIGSVTKQMTAAAVMQQVELGTVDLDDPVTDYIPGFDVGGRWPADRITVWHTLTHSSGFPDFINLMGGVGDGALTRWANLQSTIGLQAPPGSYWNYSNPNFMLAGLVAERASGVPYRDLFKQNLWEPAGMHHTTFDPQEVLDGDNFALGHSRDPRTGNEFTVGPRQSDYWAVGPAGTAFSNVGDLARWALLLMDGGAPILSQSSTAAMQHPHQSLHLTPDRFYGYGIFIEDYRGLDVRQHGGNITGFGTYLLWVPERRFVVALLTNVDQSLYEAAYCIVNRVLSPPSTPAPDMTTDPATWKRYEGDYLTTEFDGTQYEGTVYLSDGQLFMRGDKPDSPGEEVTARLHQAYLDTFLFDGNGDGTPNVDVTFCEQRGNPGFTMWLRNRYAVSEKKLGPHSGVTMAGP
jgi:CubicO group peptidase (beta-lactamase class C family)